MAEWLPYLRTLYGSGADVDAQVEVLFRYRAAITDDRLQPQDRLEILHWFSRQQAARQLFVLPTITQLFSFGSRAINAGVFALIDDLVGDAYGAELELIQKALDPSIADYRAINEHLSALLAGDVATPPVGDFSRLQDHRGAVVLLAILNGVEHWRRAQLKESLSPLATVAAMHKVVQKLDAWLGEAHGYLRYLIVYWIRLSGVTTWADRDPEAVLWNCFKTDADPIVAGAAVEAWAERQATSDDATSAAAVLLQHYDTLDVADRAWEPHVDPGDATRELGASLIRALGILVREYPDSGASRALRDVITAVPTLFLNLHVSRGEVPVANPLAIFRAVLRVRREQVAVRLWLTPAGTRGSYGPGSVAVEDPYHVRDRTPGAHSFWARPIASNLDPTAWTFQLTGPCKGSVVTRNLRRLLSPSLTYSRGDDPDFVVILGEKLSVHRSPRGAWPISKKVDEYLAESAPAVTNAVNVLARIAARHPEKARDGSLSWVWDALWQAFVVVNCKAKHVPAVDRLDRTVRHLLLSDLVSEAAFERFLGPGDRPLLEYRTVAYLLFSSVTSSPGSAARRWIADNGPQLVALARDTNLEPYVRARIAFGLLHAHDELPEYLRAELEATQFDADDAKSFIPVIRFVREAALAKEAVVLDAKSPSWPIAVAELVQWAGIWMERLARLLMNDPDANSALDVEEAAQRCQRAIAMTRGSDRYEGPVDQLAIRLAYAMGGSRITGGTLLRLRDQILRIPKSTILEHYVLSREAGGNRFDADWVRILVRLLERTQLADGRRAPTTVQQIVDRLARRRLILSELAKQAALGESGFLHRYMKLRRLDVLQGERSGWIASDGDVLAENSHEQLAILRRLRRDVPVEVASNVAIPAFVDQPQKTQRFRCLVTKLPVPADAIDFHALDVPAEERAAIAFDMLRVAGEGGAIKAIARVDHAPRQFRTKIDTGLRGVTTQVDWKAETGRRVLATLALVPSVDRARMVIASTPGVPHDLRTGDAVAAVNELRRLADAEVGPILLRATVTGKSDGSERVTINPGFRVNGEFPIVRIPGGATPNAVVTIAVSDLWIVSDRAIGVTRVEPIPDPLPEVVVGTLHTARKLPGRGRTWYVDYYDQKFPIDRRDLTADLETLYLLDTLDDDDPRLHPLPIAVKQRRVAGRVVWSVLATEPTYAVADLLLATAAREVDAIVFIRYDDEAEVSIFEIVPHSRSGGYSSLPLFGALVRLHEGDLFAADGQPLTILDSRMRRGQRFELSVAQGRLRLDGSWDVPDAAKVQETSYSLVVTSTNDINRHLEEIFARQRVVRVRRTRTAPPQLVDPPRGVPHVHIDLDARSGGPKEGEFDAITQSWDAFAPDFTLQVILPQSRDMRLGADPKGTIADWVHLRRGSVLDDVSFWQQGDEVNLSVHGCKVSLDASLYWLAPSYPTAQALAQSSVRLRKVRFTDVPTRVNYRSLMRVPSAEVPVTLDESYGVVVSVPRVADAHTITVQWLDASGEEYRLHSKLYSLPPNMGLRDIYPGNLVYAESKGVEAELYLGQRFVRATPLCQRAFAPASARELRATIFAEPQSERCGWLLVMDPGALIEIPPNEIDGEPLRDRLLDIVTLTRAPKSSRWEVADIEPGHFAEAAAQPFEARTFPSASGTIARLRATHPDFQGWPQLTIRATGRLLRGENLRYAVHGLRPVVNLEGSDLISFELQGLLVPPDAARDAVPSLVEELDASEAARLEVEGIIQSGDHGGLVVRVTSHAHDELLPLSLEEQTWVPYCASRARPSDRRLNFIAFREKGVVRISLRRCPPLALAEWLETHRMEGLSEIRRNPLYYVGAIDDSIRELCGIEDDGYLLEHTPGDCVVIPLNSLLFRGQEFEGPLLAKGEQIEVYRISRPSVGRMALDALALRHDIARELERFRNDQGILFIDLTGERPLQEQLKTMVEASGESVSFGEWRLNVEGAGDSGRREGDKAYARFEKVENGVIYCRVLPLRDVFRRGNLVYVRGVRTIVTKETSHARVEPLAVGDSGDYRIQDTRYSERRRFLESCEVRGKIYLARVEDVENKLALTIAPPRRLGAILRAVAHHDQQAIVKLVERDRLFIEIEPGFNGEIPASRLTSPDLLASLQKGDVVTLRLNWKQSRIEIRQQIQSQRESLHAELQPTVLSELWGGADYRRRQFDQNGAVEANIVGFPQLKALSQVAPARPLTAEIFPQIVVAEDSSGEFIDLVDRIGKDVEVGWLEVGDDGPALRPEGRGSLPMRWPNTVHAFACHDQLHHLVRNWRWRDFASYEPTGITDGLAIAYGHGANVSLVIGAVRPCPVDHLVEQFGTRRDARSVLVFTVARANRDVITFEIAPGRFAKLPTAMIEPLTEPFRADFATNWNWLYPGDRVHLELRPLGTRLYLPNFCIRRVEATVLRHLRDAVGPVRRDGAHLLFGPPESAIHLDDLAVLDDVVIDLRSLAVERRMDVLFKTWKSARSRTVLVGGVVPILSGESETHLDVGVDMPDRAFIKQGVKVDGGPASSEPLPTVRVRMLDLYFAEGKVRRCDYQVIREESPEALVRLTGRMSGEHVRHARPGDCVAVYAPTNSDAGGVRISGMESFSIDWSGTAGDPLRLDRQADRDLVLAKLLSKPGALLWVTVEGVNLRDRAVRVSRRKQLDAIPREEACVMRVVVLGAITPQADGMEGSILVSVAGVPLLMAPGDLCHGLRDAVEFGEFLARNAKRSQLDVVLYPDGRISAVDAYPRVEKPEFAAEVELAISSGLVCVHRTMRVFVPLAALSWSPLTIPAMEAIFLRGRTISVRRIGEDYQSFSHAQTLRFVRTAKALSTSLDRLRPRVDQPAEESDPIFVERRYVDEEIAVVETTAGLLIALRHSGQEPLPDRFPVYVEEVDLRHRRIVAASVRVAPQSWRFAHVRGTKAEALCEDELKAAIPTLVELLLPTAPREHAGEYLAVLSLTPSPRTVRRVLEIVHETGSMPGGSSENPSPFGQVWLSIGAVLRGDTVPMSPLVSFGAGYWYLLRDDIRAALPYLRESALEDTLATSFDVQLALARATYKDRAAEGTRLLRSVCRRLIAHAHGTFRPHRINVDTHLTGSAGQPPLAVVQTLPSLNRAWLIWNRIAMNKPQLGWDFDRVVADFLDAIGDEEDLDMTVDPSLWSLAALLSFSCGDVERGWNFLERVHDSETDSLEIERSWAAWLRREKASKGNPVIERVRALITSSLWRRVVSAEDFDELWKAFQASHREWSIAPKDYRILSYPARRTHLARWARAARAEATLPVVSDWLTEDEQRALTRSEPLNDETGVRIGQKPAPAPRQSA